ncbi:MAG: PAS domain S-box protein [Vicingaceae bacterium]
MSEEKEALKRLLKRERKARKDSEKILEEKSLELYQANQELKALYSSLENRYQKIVEQANDIIYRGNESGHCIFVNTVSEKILGFKKEEILGKHFTDLVIAEDQEEVINFYLKQRADKKENTYKEFRVHNKAGEIVWLGQNVSLIIENGEILGVSGVARDITKQKQAEIALKRSEEKYKRVIANMQLGLLEVDPDGLVVKAYERFCEMTGYSEKELMGKDPSTILTDPLSKELIDGKHELREKGLSDVYEVKCKRKDGQTIWLMISGAPRYDSSGNYVGSIGIHMDVTEQKKLMHQLESAKAMAEESSKAKEDFLAHMSHEIRTPLNAVIGMTHLLEDTEISEEQEDYLTTIKYSSEQLLHMVSDILDISKIESGELEFHHTPLNLKELLEGQVASYAIKAQKKNLEVRLDWKADFDQIVEADQKYLNQIFANLLSNAEKFTDKGSIVVGVELVSENEKTVSLAFHVKDSGIGMTTEQCSRIFESFQQADYNTSVRYGGTGLGLSIAKHLVELMGGNIQVKSELNKGTTFTLLIPFYKSAEHANQLKDKKLAHDISLCGMSVLVAEDNPVNQKFIKKLLEKFKVSYTLAEDGKQCLEKSRIQKFDILLLDINMPEINGYEATKIIRETKNPNQNSPIIALTASALLNDREKAFSVGMNEHLTKPFSPVQLKQILGKYHQAAETLTLDFDEEYLEDLYQGDQEFEIEMLTVFLKNGPEDFENLKNSVKKQNWEQAYQLSHKMKPTFKMVGLSQLEDKMGKMEWMSENKRDELATFFEKNKKPFEQAFEKVKSRLKTISSML